MKYLQLWLRNKVLKGKRKRDKWKTNSSPFTFITEHKIHHLFSLIKVNFLFTGSEFQFSLLFKTYIAARGAS